MKILEAIRSWLKPDLNTSKRPIILDGPPGIGKSTLIAEAKKEGFKAIDLEKETPDLNDLEAYDLIGNGSLSTITANLGTYVLLGMPPKEYIAQRNERDASNPKKRGQMPAAQAIEWMQKAQLHPDAVRHWIKREGTHSERKKEDTKQYRDKDTKQKGKAHD
jgi:hypothetical protein